MAVTFDNSNSAVGNGTVASVAITVAANSLVLVGVHFNGSPTASSPTFDGNAMTLIAGPINDVYLYRYNGHAAGSRTASVTRSTSGDWAIGVVSVTGFDTSDPDGTFQSTDTDETSPVETPAITSGSADWMLVSVAQIAADAALVVGAGQTERINLTSYNGGVLNFAMATRPGSASTQVMSWTTTGSIFGTGFIGVPIRPSAAGPVSVTVDHAQAVFQGQAIPLRYTAPLLNAQAVWQGQNVGALSGGSSVGTVQHGQATWEGQEIPFIYSVPSEAAEAVWEEQFINFEFRIKGFFADGAWEGQTVNAVANNSRIEPIIGAQAVFAGSNVGLTFTGTADTSDMVEDQPVMLRSMVYQITDTDSR